jgi:hypothetical protein
MTELPLGQWSITANGFLDVLNLTGVDANGNLSPTSTVFGKPIVGVWDGLSEKIEFILVASSNPKTHQVYTGYLMDRSAAMHQQFVFAGSFIAFGASGNIPQRTVYGWFAALPRPS